MLCITCLKRVLSFHIVHRGVSFPQDGRSCAPFVKGFYLDSLSPASLRSFWMDASNEGSNLTICSIF